MAAGRWRGGAHSIPAPAAVTGRGALSAPAPRVFDLRFGDVFEPLVRLRGFQETLRLVALDGRVVRIVRYMTR